MCYSPEHSLSASANPFPLPPRLELDSLLFPIHLTLLVLTLRSTTVTDSSPPMSLDKALTAESNHLHLSLPLPPAGVFYPSDTLQPSIRFKGDRGYTSVSFKLVGETHATIMGKTRWFASFPPSLAARMSTQRRLHSRPSLSTGR